MSTDSGYTSSLQVERRSIEYIPPEERHGKPRSLFNTWFASNMQVTAAGDGRSGRDHRALSAVALLAIVIGNLVGVSFMAAHSAQGPKLGIPQMIQSRAQLASTAPSCRWFLVLLMYVGFFATSAVLGAPPSPAGSVSTRPSPPSSSRSSAPCSPSTATG